MLSGVLSCVLCPLALLLLLLSLCPLVLPLGLLWLLLRRWWLSPPLLLFAHALPLEVTCLWLGTCVVEASPLLQVRWTSLGLVRSLTSSTMTAKLHPGEVVQIRI